ncbi:MAG: DUF502 domain-containing protein [Planctomycetota bacterium]
MKRILVTGLVFLLPALITICIILLVFRFLNDYIAQPAGALVLSSLRLSSSLSVPPEYAAIVTSLIGFAVVFAAILLIGYITTKSLGRRLYLLLEKYLFHKLPVIGFIYPHAKQFTDTFLDLGKKNEFKAVVSVQFPRLGVYAIGFITSEGLDKVKIASGKKLVTVFIPNTPTPFTGDTVMFSEEDIIRLNITVDDAIRFVISGGILTPNNHNQPAL